MDPYETVWSELNQCIVLAKIAVGGINRRHFQLRFQLEVEVLNMRRHNRKTVCKGACNFRLMRL